MYDTQPRLMCILAHPDDESLAVGGILAHYSEMDVEIALVCATRGEHGWFGPPAEYPGVEALGRLRERELLSAAEILGIQEVRFLGYVDGELDRAEPDEVIGKLVAELRRFRPHVVVTFDPLGGYGHPDHIAISQFATAAVAAAANPLYFAGPWPPYQVEKLYFQVWTQGDWARYEDIFGALEMEIDGVARNSQSWAEWAVTTQVDTAHHWQRVLSAVLCHQSQLIAPERLIALDESQHRLLWGNRRFYRAMSLVNGGRGPEMDLLEGLRCRLPRSYYRRSATQTTQVEKAQIEKAQETFIHIKSRQATVHMQNGAGASLPITQPPATQQSVAMHAEMHAQPDASVRMSEQIAEQMSGQMAVEMDAPLDIQKALGVQAFV